MHFQLVANGLFVYVQGYPMLVSDLKVIQDSETGATKSNPTGQFVRFTGHCTEHPANDQIRKSMYNGGTYGGNKLAGYVW